MGCRAISHPRYYIFVSDNKSWSIAFPPPVLFFCCHTWVSPPLVAMIDGGQTERDLINSQDLHLQGSLLFGKRFKIETCCGFWDVSFTLCLTSCHPYPSSIHADVQHLEWNFRSPINFIASIAFVMWRPCNHFSVAECLGFSSRLSGDEYLFGGV